jgi:hypothetical protein
MEVSHAHKSIRNGLNSENIPFDHINNKFFADKKHYDTIKSLFMFFIHKEGEELQLKVDNEIVSIIFS